MSSVSDVIVVGSGPAGVQAAEALVEAGASVTMLDVGFEASPDVGQIPARPFVEMRRTDPEQHRYLLGPRFEGVPFDQLGAGPQVTPPRQHMLRTAVAYHPTMTSDDFVAMESHALGGLGAGWGAVCFPYHDVELRRSGLPVPGMKAHYERVAARVGVSGARDDLESVRGSFDCMQPPLELDHNASAILAHYERRRDRFARRGLRVGHTLLAALSQGMDGRKAHSLDDMDFWSNAGEAVYRPEVTLCRLRSKENFCYTRGWLVERFAENGHGVVQVEAIAADGSTRETFAARRLILAAGAMGTTRIVLLSLRAFDCRVPFVCNAHMYVPCLHLRRLGAPYHARSHSLAQLTLIHDPTGTCEHLAQAQMYSYRSLLLFRLLKEAPLAQRESLRILRALASSFVIWAVEQEDEPAASSFCRLRATSAGSTLEAVHQPGHEVESARRKSEAALTRGMRMLGCWPIRSVHSGHGSSLHYGGQFPSSPRDEPLTTDASGRLRGTRSVYIADGAALRYLPAKGLTFTLMANADRVATEVIQSFPVSA